MIAPLIATALLAGTGPCTATEIRASNGMLEGATGTMLGVVYLRNVSQARCALGGRPRVRIMTRSHALLVTRERTFALADTGGRPVNALRAGQTAVLHLDWSNWCGSWVGRIGSFRTLDLRITLTNTARLTLPIRTGRPRCDAPNLPSSLFVSTFATS